MESRLSESSSIREAYERAERLKTEYGADGVFDFSIGNPTAPCPAGVKQALAQTLELSGPEIHGYMQDSGYGEVRQTVASSLNARFGSAYKADHIVMTTGAACALNVLMRTVLDPGDEVVVFDPCYPAYSVFAETFRAHLVRIPFDQQTMLPDLVALERALTDKTKMVLVNTPHNPTGLVYPRETAEGIVEALNAQCVQTGQEIMLVSDEPYRELVYDDAENPWWPALYKNTAVVYSWSKAASVAGERIGYLAVSPEVPDAELVLRGSRRSLGELGFVNAPATAQRIACACANDTIDISYYDRNRLALYNGLVACGLSPLRGNGAFYLLLPAPDGNEAQFVERLAGEQIIAVAGASFGCPGYVRLSYCVSLEAIENSLPHFAAVARMYSETEGNRS